MQIIQFSTPTLLSDHHHKSYCDQCHSEDLSTYFMRGIGGDPTLLYSTALFCTLLYCTTLCCTVLHHTALQCTCNVLYCSECIILYCKALICDVLYSIVRFCTILYYTVLPCTALYCTVLHCTVSCCTILYCYVLCCTLQYCTVLYCTVLYFTLLYCTVMIMCCADLHGTIHQRILKDLRRKANMSLKKVTKSQAGWQGTAGGGQTLLRTCFWYHSGTMKDILPFLQIPLSIILYTCICTYILYIFILCRKLFTTI